MAPATSSYTELPTYNIFPNESDSLGEEGGGGITSLDTNSAARDSGEFYGYWDDRSKEVENRKNYIIAESISLEEGLGILAYTTTTPDLPAPFNIIRTSLFSAGILFGFFAITPLFGLVFINGSLSILISFLSFGLFRVLKKARTIMRDEL